MGTTQIPGFLPPLAGKDLQDPALFQVNLRFEQLQSAILALSGGVLPQISAGTQTITAWNASTTYAVGAEVTYSGYVWQALRVNKNSAPVSGSANWTKVSPTSLQNYKGSWDSGVAYSPGDEVSFEGMLWQAMAENVDSAPSPSNTNWASLGPTNLGTFQGAWSSSVAYGIGDEVSHNNYVWQATQANSDSEPSTSNPNWIIIGPASLQAYKGTWSSSISYYNGDQVTYQGYLWAAAAPNTNSAPVVGNVNWNQLGPSTLANWQGAWSGSVTYQAGMEVANGGYVWQASQQSTNQVPSTGSAFWYLVGPASLQNFQGAWNGGLTYQPGMEVSYNSYLWQASAQSTGQTPATGSAYWNQLGPITLQNYQGGYSGSTAYLAGMSVSYGGNVYQATENVPVGTAPTNTSYWVLVGPTNFDFVADGGTFLKIGSVNTSNQTTTSSYSNRSVSASYSAQGTSSSITLAVSPPGNPPPGTQISNYIGIPGSDTYDLLVQVSGFVNWTQQDTSTIAELDVYVFDLTTQGGTTYQTYSMDTWQSSVTLSGVFPVILTTIPISATPGGHNFALFAQAFLQSFTVSNIVLNITVLKA